MAKSSEKPAAPPAPPASAVPSVKWGLDGHPQWLHLPRGSPLGRPTDGPPASAFSARGPRRHLTPWLTALVRTSVLKPSQESFSLSRLPAPLLLGPGGRWGLRGALPQRADLSHPTRPLVTLPCTPSSSQRPLQGGVTPGLGGGCADGGRPPSLPGPGPGPAVGLGSWLGRCRTCPSAGPFPPVSPASARALVVVVFLVFFL